MNSRTTLRLPVADLAWAFFHARARTPAERREVAAALGLERVVEQRVPPESTGGASSGRRGEVARDVPLLRLERFELPAPRVPAPIGAPGRRPAVSPPPPAVRASIVPWPRLWAWLAGQFCAAAASGDPDVDAFVERMSRGLAIERLPRLPLRRSAPRIACLEDWSWRLAPFWRDMDEVALRLARIFRRTLSRRVLHGGPYGSVAEIRDQQVFDAAPLEPGCPVLALSDLGALFDPQARYRERNEATVAEREWLAYGEELIRRGHTLHALVPGPTAMIHPQVAKLWHPEPWDRVSRGPLRSYRQRLQRAERLLTLAAPAVRIEGGYLRDLRAVLGDEGDLLMEADAFLHEKVDDTYVSVQGLDAGAAEAWRRRWQAGSADADAVAKEVALAARDAMRRWHAALPEEIRHEETLRLLAAGKALVTDAELAEARWFFGNLLREVREGEPRAGLAAWFAGFDQRNEEFGSDPELRAVLDELMQRLRPAGHQTRLRVDEPAPDGGPPRQGWLRLRGASLCLDDSATQQSAADTGVLLGVVGYGSGLWLDVGGPRAEPLPIDRHWAVPIDTLRAALRIRSDQGTWHMGILERPAWAAALGADSYGAWVEIEVKRAKYRLRWIPPGRFWMGSPPGEPERDEDETRHEVVLTRGYWLGETAVTQGFYQAVMGNNPSHFKGADRPMETVRWTDSVQFSERLEQTLQRHAGARLSEDGLTWRLPTEAEWEYACRAGTTTPFSFGATMTPEQVNYDGNYPYPGGRKGRYREKTVPVGSLPANAWGLYEMHGNVWEWCSDWLGEYPAGVAVDPEGPSTGSLRVLRGGSWFSLAGHCRSAQRNAFVPGYRFGYVGFRVARGPVREPAGGARSSAGG